MVLSKTTSCNVIEIWQPRWKDRKVLLAKYKVGTHNKVVFTKTPSMKGEYYINGKTVRKYPIVDNGKLACYAVPLDELEILERE